MAAVQTRTTNTVQTGSRVAASVATAKTGAVADALAAPTPRHPGSNVLVEPVAVVCKLQVCPSLRTPRLTPRGADDRMVRGEVLPGQVWAARRTMPPAIANYRVQQAPTKASIARSVNLSSTLAPSKSSAAVAGNLGIATPRPSPSASPRVIAPVQVPSESVVFPGKFAPTIKETSRGACQSYEPPVPLASMPSEPITVTWTPLARNRRLAGFSPPVSPRQTRPSAGPQVSPMLSPRLVSAPRRNTVGTPGGTVAALMPVFAAKLPQQTHPYGAFSITASKPQPRSLLGTQSTAILEVAEPISTPNSPLISARLARHHAIATTLPHEVGAVGASPPLSNLSASGKSSPSPTPTPTPRRRRRVSNGSSLLDSWRTTRSVSASPPRSEKTPIATRFVSVSPVRCRSAGIVVQTSSSQVVLLSPQVTCRTVQRQDTPLALNRSTASLCQSQSATPVHPSMQAANPAQFQRNQQQSRTVRSTVVGRQGANSKCVFNKGPARSAQPQKATRNNDKPVPSKTLAALGLPAVETVSVQSQESQEPYMATTPSMKSLRSPQHGAPVIGHPPQPRLPAPGQRARPQEPGCSADVEPPPVDSFFAIDLGEEQDSFLQSGPIPKRWGDKERGEGPLYDGGPRSATQRRKRWSSSSPMMQTPVRPPQGAKVNDSERDVGGLRPLADSMDNEELSEVCVRVQQKLAELSKDLTQSVTL